MTRGKEGEMNGKDTNITEMTFEFALIIVDLYRYLKRQGESVMSKQLLRSATSIGANVEEAQAAQSKKDFVAKMAIASKEARETRYWLRLLEGSGFLRGYDGDPGLKSRIHSIISVLTRIIKTTQENLRTVGEHK